MSEDIVKALDASTKAFEDFKSLNEQRLAKLEKDQTARAAELKEDMRKAFDDMQAHAARIEAKALNRPGNAGTADADATTAEHKQAFGSYMRKGVEFDRDLEVKALNVAAGADGGYAVPKVIDGMIEALVVNVSPIRSIAAVQQVSTSDFHKLVNLRGTASGWVGETAARTASNTPTLADVTPPMGELYSNPQATQKMLDDVFFDAESWLAGEVALEFARAEGEAFVSGSGVNQPKGFLSYTNVKTGDSTRTFGQIEYVATGQAADWAAASPSDILFTCVSKIKAAYRANGKWVMPKSILFELASFKDSGGRYVFNPISAPGVPQTLLNYPVVEAEDMPAKAANAYSVAFADWSRAYLIVDRVGTRVLRDPFSNKPYIGFYTVKRLGGAVVNSEAIKLIKFEA